MNDADEPELSPASVDLLREKLIAFLTKALAREGTERCIEIELLLCVPNQPLRKWNRTDPTAKDQEAVLEIVLSILSAAHLDSFERPPGRYDYAVVATNVDASSSIYKFGASTLPAAVSDPATQSPYFHTTMRTIRISSPVDIEITTSPGASMIRVKNPVDIEISTSVDSSHAPRPEPAQHTLEVIIAAIQPVIAQIFQKLDQSRRQTGPEN